MSYLKVVERQPSIRGTSNNLMRHSFPDLLFDLNNEEGRFVEL